MLGIHRTHDDEPTGHAETSREATLPHADSEDESAGARNERETHSDTHLASSAVREQKEAGEHEQNADHAAGDSHRRN